MAAPVDFEKPPEPLRHTSRMEGRAAREAGWLELQRQLERERGVVGRLRALRTRARVALVAVCALAPAAVMTLRHHATLELAHGVVAGLVVASAAVLLSSLGAPRHGTRRAWLAWLSALLPVAGALAWAELGAVAHDAQARSASAAACFGLGAAYAAPSVLLALVIARTPLRSTTELALLAGLCGMSASLMLDLHCESRQLGHLLLGHSSVGVAWAVAYRAAQAATTGSGSSSGRSKTKTMSKMS